MACNGMTVSRSVLMLACFPFRSAHCEMGMLIAIASRFFVNIIHVWTRHACAVAACAGGFAQCAGSRGQKNVLEVLEVMRGVLVAMEGHTTCAVVAEGCGGHGTCVP